MSGSVDFSQMARSWALVPRPGVLLQHVVTLPPAGCCSQPLTRTLERQGTYPCTRRRWGVWVFGSRVGGLATPGCLAVWSGFLHLFPRLAATHTPRPSPNPWVRGVCQSCVLICSHLPRWFFSSRPPIQGAASTFHSSLLSSQSREPAAHNPHLPHPAPALFNCPPPHRLALPFALSMRLPVDTCS